MVVDKFKAAMGLLAGYCNVVVVDVVNLRMYGEGAMRVVATT